MKKKFSFLLLAYQINENDLKSKETICKAAEKLFKLFLELSTLPIHPVEQSPTDTMDTNSITNNTCKYLINFFFHLKNFIYLK